MRPFYLILTLVSFALSYFSIQDNKIYDVGSGQFYSDEELINFLICDSNFYNNQNFKKYKKSYTNLQFEKKWWTYLILIGSWGAGIEGINHPERWEEGGDNYDLGEDNSPPGIDNIIFGSLFFYSYHGYNKIRKERSLYRLIQDYNYFYFEKDKELDIPYPFVDNIRNRDYWKSSYSFGYSSEKAGSSMLDVSIDFAINDRDYIYFSYGNFFILGQSVGFGYKHYLKSRYNHSSFLGISLSGSLSGDGNTTWAGTSTHLTLGQSVKILNREPAIIFINVGLVASYSNIRFYENTDLGEKYSLELLPLINLETRF
tara:strand:+ start:1225 stop:2166 length:942 start_codon:yes stop_codon:yes gene_type:complete